MKKINVLNLNPDYFKIKLFLTKNGWYESEEVDDYISFLRDGYFGVDLNENEILFIDDGGIFLQLPFNYYALVGAMYIHLVHNFKL